MAEERERDEEEFEDEEEYENDGDGGGDDSLVESLVSQIRDHRELIAPVATTAAAAAATYAAKKLPDLISQLEGTSGDTIREKLGEASNAGGMKGFAAGAASRAL